jgi:hypothetical protein
MLTINNIANFSKHTKDLVKLQGVALQLMFEKK